METRQWLHGRKSVDAWNWHHHRSMAVTSYLHEPVAGKGGRTPQACAACLPTCLLGGVSVCCALPDLVCGARFFAPGRVQYKIWRAAR